MEKSELLENKRVYEYFLKYYNDAESISLKLSTTEAIKYLCEELATCIAVKEIREVFKSVVENRLESGQDTDLDKELNNELNLICSSIPIGCFLINKLFSKREQYNAHHELIKEKLNLK